MTCSRKLAFTDGELALTGFLSELNPVSWTVYSGASASSSQPHSDIGSFVSALNVTDSKHEAGDFSSNCKVLR